MSVSQYQTSVYEVYFGRDFPYLVIATNPQLALEEAKSHELREVTFTSVKEILQFWETEDGGGMSNSEIWEFMLSWLKPGELDPQAVKRWKNSSWMRADTCF